MTDQFCLCGAQPGYQHSEDCPRPLYIGSDEQDKAWFAERDSRRITLKARELRQDREM